MGTKRKQSSSRSIKRFTLSISDRETLLPCPACDGQKQKLIEKSDGTYKMRRCIWCDGHGYVDHNMFRVYKRWLRIWNHNRLHGNCDGK